MRQNASAHIFSRECINECTSLVSFDKRACTNALTKLANERPSITTPFYPSAFCTYATQSITAAPPSPPPRFSLLSPSFPQLRIFAQNRIASHHIASALVFSLFVWELASGHLPLPLPAYRINQSLCTPRRGRGGEAFPPPIISPRPTLSHSLLIATAQEYSVFSRRVRVYARAMRVREKTAAGGKQVSGTTHWRLFFPMCERSGLTYKVAVMRLVGGTKGVQYTVKAIRLLPPPPSLYHLRTTRWRMKLAQICIAKGEKFILIKRKVKSQYF